MEIGKVENMTRHLMPIRNSKSNDIGSSKVKEWKNVHKGRLKKPWNLCILTCLNFKVLSI